MKWLFPTLLFFVNLLSASPSDDAIAIARSKGLATSRTWLNLVQYVKSPISGYESLVTSPSFFLDSARGPKSPEQELNATIRSFFESIPDKSDQHCACRFPARKAWLVQQGVL